MAKLSIVFSTTLLVLSNAYVANAGVKDWISAFAHSCGMTGAVGNPAVGKFSKLGDELAGYKSWGEGIGIYEGSELRGTRPYLGVGKKEPSTSHLHINPRNGNMRAWLPIASDMDSVADRVRRLGVAGIVTKRQGSNRAIPFGNVEVSGLNGIEVHANASNGKDVLDALKFVHDSSSTPSDSLLSATKINRNERAELRKWFDANYQQKGSGGVYQSTLDFNRVFPPSYAAHDAPVLTDSQISTIDSLIDAGLIDGKLSWYVDKNLPIADDLVTNRIIHERWQKIGTEVDAIRGGEQIQAAQLAWEAAGKPKLTPELMRKVIDPQLQRRAGSRNAIITKAKVDAPVPGPSATENVVASKLINAKIKRPDNVKQIVFDEWSKLKAEQEEALEKFKKRLNDKTKEAKDLYTSPEYKQLREIDGKIEQIESSNLAIRRSIRKAQAYTDEEIKEKLDMLISETFRFNVGSQVSGGRALRPGYENKNLGQLAEDSSFRSALSEEFKRLYYEEAVEYGNVLDRRLEEFITRWYYP